MVPMRDHEEQMPNEKQKLKKKVEQMPKARCPLTVLNTQGP